MHFDAAITPKSLSEVPALARAAEAAGLAAVWTSETQHNPFLPLPLVAEHSTNLQFGTGLAIGFARIPMTLATAARTPHPPTARPSLPALAPPSRPPHCRPLA